MIWANLALTPRGMFKLMAMRIVNFKKYPLPIIVIRVLNPVMYLKELKRLSETTPTRKSRVKF